MAASASTKVKRYLDLLSLSGLEKERTRRAYARNGCGGKTVLPLLSVVMFSVAVLLLSVLGVLSWSDATCLASRGGVLNSAVCPLLCFAATDIAWTLM